MINGKIWLSSPTMYPDSLKYVEQAYETNWVAPLGPNVDAFEREMSAYVGVKAAAACVSGTSALFLAYKLAGVKAGDIVFCSDMTFAATVNPVTYLGGQLVFIDSERDSWNMDPAALEKAFEKYPQCKCVGVAHLYGSPAKLDEIRAICDAHGAKLVEDAAESLSAAYKGRATGSFGDFGVVSFNGNKIITSSGGGMLLSNDTAAIERAHFLSTQARDPAPWYQHSEIGYNFRMSNIVAGIGRAQLEHLDEHRDKKEAIYRRYQEGFAGTGISMNPYLACSRPNFWLSCLLLDKSVQIKPAEIAARLSEIKAETRPIWKPMHLQPVYAQNDFISVEGDVGGEVFARGLCLPSDIKMLPEEQDRIIEIIRETVG